MSGNIQFWFEFASTYSYLSAMRIEAAAARHDVTVTWHPFLLGPIFADQGWNTSPFNIYPAKGRYMWRDMERLCEDRGLPLRRPDPFPQNGLLAARLVLAADEAGNAADLTRAIYHAEFALGRDISLPDTLLECLDLAGLPADLLERAGTGGIKTQLRENVAQAKALGLFGAPSFVAGSDLYWGDDRLDQALRHAARI